MTQGWPLVTLRAALGRTCATDSVSKGDRDNEFHFTQPASAMVILIPEIIEESKNDQI